MDYLLMYIRIVTNKEGELEFKGPFIGDFGSETKIETKAVELSQNAGLKEAIISHITPIYSDLESARLTARSYFDSKIKDIVESQEIIKATEERAKRRKQRRSNQ